MKHFNITFEPEGRHISIHAGATILEAANHVGIILNSVCGGSGTCGKCVVNVGPDSKQVLACQERIKSDLTVTIPAGSRFIEQKILTEGIDVQVGIQPDIPGKLPQVNTADEIFGLAVDIGTTTVVAKLINLADGNCRATAAALNPQTQFGDDVVSRIAYAETEAKLLELHRIIIDCINRLITQLCEKASVAKEYIYRMCIVGNTTMNHIFLKLPVKQLGQAPYRAFSLDARDLPAAETPLQINPAGNIHTVENIAGFVGADTTAVALAAGVDSADEMTLIVDIGTNGELVLGTKDKLYAASCAAGPALEGARISQGSRAAEGAIEAVVVNDDDIDVDVIGNTQARSICGSGLIDAVATLLDLGVLNPSGRLIDSQKLRKRLSPAVFSRIVEKNGQPAFVLAYANTGQPQVLLTQKDIRETQLAKAAIRAGIKLLQRKIGLEDDDIKHILLAGAFGNYIRRESALRIALLPAVPPARIRFVGNAAASGAQMVLLSQRYRALAGKLARKIEYVEIANEPDFTSVYADCMLF